MKKFISFVMAGAMVASLVPATAFAKGEVTATAKVVDAKDLQKGETAVFTGEDGPEAQLKITSVDYQTTYTELPKMEITLTLDNAEFTKAALADPAALVKVKNDAGKSIIGTDSPAIETGAPTTEKTTYTDVDKTTYADAVAAGADGFVNDKTATKDSDAGYKAFSEYKAIEKVDAMTGAEYKAYLEGKGYKLMVIDLASYYALVKDGVLQDKISEATVNAGVLPVAAKSVAEQINADFTALGGANKAFVKRSHTPSYAGQDVVGTTNNPNARVVVEASKEDDDEIKVTIRGFFEKDDVVAVDLKSTLTKSSVNTKATVSIDSKMVSADDLVFASIVDKGIKASVKKVVDIATEEKVLLDKRGIKLETVVGKFAVGQEIELKLSNGFEFDTVKSGTDYSVVSVDDKIATIKVKTDKLDEFTILGDDVKIESTSAKSGAVATLTVKAVKNDKDENTFSASTTVEVAKVVDYKVNFTVDKDEDIPVIYSGTNVDNAGLTDDSDHMSLEVTAEETFPGAWSMRQGFNFNLPAGVYVTDVKIGDKESLKIDQKDASSDQIFDAFKKAYKDGDHKNFEFGKRVFDDVDVTLNSKKAKLSFQLELVADPTFEGDVKLTMEGALLDKQEVTIAKFVKPYTVKAEQNDVIIDYRNTEVKTPIVITEAAAGLWKKDATFKLNIEDDLLTFENDPTFTIDKDSDMKLKDDKADKGTIKFSVKEESDKAASITISDMKLFMSRSIPAGAYDLEISTTMKEAYDRQKLFAPDATTVADWKSGDRPTETTTKKDSYVDDVCDYSDVVKAAFINVVTSGRDNDNLFTTKVVVPVGEAYLLAGEAKVELDAPAYISAAGYTMLPVRAISKALGVNTNNVLWNAETRTVTVMYAQRIITMTVGQKTIYVNGSAIPSSAAPEIKDGRTFLPLRDLGTALGVTNVNWDAATKTATLN